MESGGPLLAGADDSARIQQELLSIEESGEFTRAPVMRRLLKFLVTESLAGRGGQVKAYTIAVDGLGRPEDFDAQHDSYPRVQAGRLRRMLENYYASHRSVSGFRFEMRSGGYEIVFVPVDGSEKLPDTKKDLQKKRRFFPLAIASILIIGASILLIHRFFDRDLDSILGTNVRDNREAQWVDLPVLDILPVQAAQKEADQDELADFLSSSLTDAAKRSGWLKIRVPDAAQTNAANDGKAGSSRYLLRSRLYDKQNSGALYVEAIERSSGLVLWSRTLPLPYSSDGSLGDLRDVLAKIVNGVVEPGGAVAERELQRVVRSNVALGYPCLIYAREARYHRALNTYDEVQACLEHTVDAMPNATKAWALLALLELDRAQSQSSLKLATVNNRHALDLANRAVHDDPVDSFALAVLANAQYRLGDYARAQITSRKALEVNPYSIFLSARMGSNLYFMGDPRALSYVREAISVTSVAPSWAYIPLFFDALMHDQRSEALTQLAAMFEAEGTDKTNQASLRAIGAVLEGDKEKAHAYWEVVLKNDPLSRTNPEHVFARYNVPRPFSERAVNILRSGESCHRCGSKAHRDNLTSLAFSEVACLIEKA